MDSAAKVYTHCGFADEADANEITASINAAISKAIFPPQYRMTDEGLLWEKPSDKEIPDVRLIAGSFEVLAMTRDLHSESWGTLLRWQDADGFVHQLAIGRAMLAGDGREVRAALLSGGLYVSPAMADRTALNALLVQVKIDRRARAVSRIGWADRCFALPDRTISPPDTADLVVYQGAAATDHEYRFKGTLEGWQESVARFAPGNSRLAIALCAGFAGPLLELAGAEGGGLHLRGDSSSGKTTALQAAASIWGPPSFVRQWRATSNGLEGIAELSNHTLLVLDELKQLDPKEAGSVAYLLANGSGKSRAGQSGEARTSRRWCTFFLSSGELSLAEHARADGRGRKSAAGQEVRILDVEADPGKGHRLFDTLHGFAHGGQLADAIKQGSATHYGVAGPEFVARLMGQIDEVGETVRKGIDAFTTDTVPEGASGQVRRAAQRFGLLAMAGEIAANLGILPWQPGEATRAAKTVCAGWIVGRGGAGDAEDRDAVEQIRLFVATHGASRFQRIEGDDRTIHNRAGFMRRDQSGGTEYLVMPTVWRSEVCAGLNSKSVSALMAASGHLVTDAAGKFSVLVNAPDVGRTRFYIIRQSIFGDDDA